MPKIGEIDQDGSRAYELSVKSDQAREAGNLALARELMVEAAALDGRYGVRAEFVGQSDTRAPRVASTLRKLLIAPLLQEGFRTRDDAPWKSGMPLERRVAGVSQSLIPGVDKFGGAIGVMAWREAGGDGSHFDWSGSSLRSARLNYRTQAELEAVCRRWHRVLTEEVFPWLAHGGQDSVDP